MLTFVVLALVLPACLAQHAQCYPPSTWAHVMFLDVDKDTDGVMHLTEMIDDFHVYDVNGDGRVSRHEYTEHQVAIDPTFSNMAHALYNLYDFNGDHHLDMADYVAFYRAIDSDGDDSVSEAEFRTYWEHLLCRLGHNHNSFCMDAC